MLGAIVYLGISAGLIIFSQPESGELRVNPIVIMALAIIAGYNWEWLEKKLSAVTESK